MTLPPNDPELDRALADRAISRSMRGIALSGGVLGVLALAFLVVAEGRLGAQSIPQLAILGLGWATGVVLPVYCVRLQRALRGARIDPFDACADLDIALRRAVIGLPVTAVLLGAGLVAAIEPHGTTTLSAALALAILAQLVAVLVTLRSGLRRTARRLA